jgi:hypothetical protein
VTSLAVSLQDVPVDASVGIDLLRHRLKMIGPNTRSMWAGITANALCLRASVTKMVKTEPLWHGSNERFIRIYVRDHLLPLVAFLAVETSVAM